MSESHSSILLHPRDRRAEFGIFLASDVFVDKTLFFFSGGQNHQVIVHGFELPGDQRWI